MAASGGASRKGPRRKNARRGKARGPASRRGRRLQGSLSPAFSELVGRALTDKEFRAALFRNRPSAVRGFRLTKADLEALRQLTKRQLDLQASRLGSRTAWTIKIVVKIRF
jgi:hypothetical protein